MGIDNLGFGEYGFYCGKRKGVKTMSCERGRDNAKKEIAVVPPSKVSQLLSPDNNIILIRVTVKATAKA